MRPVKTLICGGWLASVLDCQTSCRSPGHDRGKDFFFSSSMSTLVQFVTACHAFVCEGHTNTIAHVRDHMSTFLQDKAQRLVAYENTQITRYSRIIEMVVVAVYSHGGRTLLIFRFLVSFFCCCFFWLLLFMSEGNFFRGQCCAV